MTQTMRDKLQALVDECNQNGVPSLEWLFGELESILATEPPAVTVRAGWYAKDFNGISWYQEEPVFDGRGHWCRRDFDSDYIEDLDGILTDPWPDHPDGGPECCMEVK